MMGSTMFQFRLVRIRPLALVMVLALTAAAMVWPTSQVMGASEKRPDSSAEGSAVRAGSSRDVSSEDQLLEAGLDEALSDQGDSRAGHRAGGGAALRPEDLPQAMAVLRDYRPELVERFEGWAVRHPQRASSMLSRTVPTIGRLIRMRRDDPQGYELAIKDLRYFRATTIVSRELRQARQAGDQARAAELSRKLQAQLAQHFDVRQAIRERDIQKLQQRLEQLRKQLALRKSARDRILEKRFEQLGDPDEKVPW